MEATQLRVRPATENDRELFWQLQLRALRPYVEATWGWDENDQIDRFAAAFSPVGREVIELEGRAIGGLHVEYGSAPVRLLNVQILPAYQRQGYGSAIIQRVLSRAGSTAVWLQVLKVNPAKALYERLGFRVVAETATHWQLVREPAA